MRQGRKPKVMTAVGLLLGLLVVWMMWIAAKNILAYARMRKAEVVVAGSTLRVHGADSALSEGELYGFTLQLALETVDGADRQIVEEIELDKAAYLEEALDELEYWKAGTRHTVRYLRGDAREVRLEGTSSPEVARAIGAFFGAVMFLLPALALLAAMSEEDGWLQRFRWARGLGAWTVFLAVGGLCVCGALAFLVGYVVKARTWMEVEAQTVRAEQRAVAVELPAGVTVEEGARKALAEQKYQVLEFSMQGRKLHGGMGSGGRRGVLDGMSGVDGGKFRFHVNPADRWEVTQDALWGETFWVPFASFAGFGLAFCGVSFLVRSSEMRFR